MSVPERATADPESTEPGEKRRFVWTSLGVFTLLTVILFWRYAFGFRTTVSDRGDPLLLIWVMEWVERALVHSPGELFDAPMFHPFKDVLAYSDPLIPQSLIALPLRWIGFGPIAAYNIVYLTGIIAAGVVTALLFFEVTGDRTAAMFGAAVATFPGLRLFHLAHMQLQVTALWPVVLLLVHRLVRRPTASSTAWLAVALVALPLASLYHGMFLALLLPPFALSAWFCTPKRSTKSVAALLAAAVASGLVLLPFGRVYSRAIAHVGRDRSNPGFCDALDYFSVSLFSEMGRALHLRAVRDASPEWIGGGAALLLPIALVAVAIHLVRRAPKHRQSRKIEGWARACAPYALLGCLALALSFGPQVTWGGKVIVSNPLGHVASLPGVREIRDFQRLGFVVALAGGAVIAVGLVELARRGMHRIRVASLAFVAVTTAIPAFSASLPAYRPPSAAALNPAYHWLAAQPDPVVLYEVPLAGRNELESLDYLWAAVAHKKTLVHGFSGFLPLTDDALRGEATGVHDPDFFRALALLGATHLFVHTDALAALPGGAVSLANLRADRGADRIAHFSDIEVYRVEPVRTEVVRRHDEHLQKPLFATGGWDDSNKGCLEIGPPMPPVVLYVPQSARVAGLHFYAESPLTEMNESLVIERSDDLRNWRTLERAPLLSTTVATYLFEPTALLWTDATVAPASGPFLRVWSRHGKRLRLCDPSVASAKDAPFERVPREALRVATSVQSELAPLAVDGKLGTRWHTGAEQQGGEWISVDLGRPREVVAVILELDEFVHDRGRELAVECAEPIDTVTPPPRVLGDAALFARPLSAQVLPFVPPRSCRVIRVRQTGHVKDTYWSVAEIAILERAAPAARADVQQEK